MTALLVDKPPLRALGWHALPLVTLLPDLSVLVDRVRQGDRAAFDSLYDELAPVLFGVVKRVVRDPTMSEEVTQEVFVEIWRTASRFDPAKATVSSWAITIARRRAVDRVRREQSQRNRVTALQQQRHDAVDSPDESLIASLDAQRVRRALDVLPADQRQVIELAFIEGHAHASIAEQLGIPLGTVKGRVRGGLKRLRGELGAIA